MKLSHQRIREPGAPHPRASHIIAHAQAKEFSVLRLAPQYPAGPEYVACAGSNAVAHFFEQKDAVDYCQWRNDNARRSPQPKPDDRVHQSP